MDERALHKSSAVEGASEAGQQCGEVDFCLLAESLPHLVWSARPDGVSDYYNARFLEYLGKTREEMQGWAWAETLHPDDRQRSIDNWATAFTTGAEYYEEYRIRRAADGQYRWHEGRAVPLRDAAGKVVRWIGTCTDIEERKQADERLRRSEQKFRALHESMMDAFVSVDMTGRIMEFNRVYQELLGYTGEELRNLTYVDLTPAKWHDMEARIVAEQILPHGYSDVYEKEYSRKDGTLVPIELRTFLLRDADDTPSQMWAIIRDISARKALQERYRRLSSLTSDYVHYCIRKGTEPYRVQWIDGAFKPISGYSAEAIYEIGCFLPVVHPEDRQAVSSYLLELVPGNRRSIEFRIISKQGEVRWVSETSYCETGPSEGELSLYGAVSDITERKHYEAVLQQSEQRYRAIVESQTEYVCRFAPGGVLTYVNQALAKWYGADPKDLVGRSFYPFLQEQDREGVARKIEALTCNGPTVTLELLIPSRNGELCWQQWTDHAICDAQGRIIEYQGVGRDITERKAAELYLAHAKEILEGQVAERTASLTQANEQLNREIEERRRIEQDLRNYQRQLETTSLEVSHAADRERARIAGELHDEVGQRLMLARIKLDALSELCSDPAHAQPLQELQQLIDQTIADIRSLTFQLRPPILASAGLVAAVQWLGEELKQSYGLAIEIGHDGRHFDFPYEAKAAIFQTVRELLLNVAKHADTDRANVSFRATTNALTIMVEDYGVGFDVGSVLAAPGPREGFGLFNIQQRIRYLGGWLDFDSLPGKGSRVTINVPWSLATERGLS